MVWLQNCSFIEVKEVVNSLLAELTITQCEEVKGFVTDYTKNILTNRVKANQLEIKNCEDRIALAKQELADLHAKIGKL